MNEKREKKDMEQEVLRPIYAPSALWGRYLEGSVNGVNFRIPTDRTVYVSEVIAQLVEDSQRNLTAGATAVADYRTQMGCRIG